MNVLRLIRKDLRLQRNVLLPLILLEVAGYLAYTLQMLSEIPGVAFGLLHGIALIGDFLICYRTMVAEEKNRALLFVKTLPVSTGEIVMAKFGVNFLLVSLNTGALLTLWQSIHLLGWTQVRPMLNLHLVIGAVTLHLLNNAFFLTISLLFDSERAVWVPFPAIFALISLIINFRKIERSLHLEPLVRLLTTHDLLLLALLWMVIASFVTVSSWAMAHKRICA